jgi:uncharacterized membrane protein
MSFSAPVYLLLLLALPLIVWLGWPARARRRSVREWLILALRVTLTVLIVFGLAGLELRRLSDRLSVVFLVDGSDSMRVPLQIETEAGPELTTPYELGLAFVRQALTAMPTDDRAGVIVFGADAAIERSLSGSARLDLPTARISTLQTDLAGAIRLGLALLPADTMRRIVIVSDGGQTTGDAIAAAQLAASAGVEIDVAPFVTTGGAEALITSVSAPTRLREREQFGLEVRIESTLNQTVGYRVLAGSEVVTSGTFELRRGTNAYTLPLQAGEPGFTPYRVQIIPATGADTFYQNNDLAAFSTVTGPPRLLLVRNPAPRDGVVGDQELIAALQSVGLPVEVITPELLPVELPNVAEYAGVILVDVPARALSARQMNNLELYVRDLGGGLIAVGGPTSYGVGGYYQTPLERLLPVEMPIRDERRRAQVSMVFVIDHSGSMSEVAGGVSKLDLSKEAVIRSMDLLMPNDQVGVIIFDDTAKTVVSLGPLDDVSAMQNRVAGVGIGGGTDILAGVQAASRMLDGADTLVKHVILLTDGGADPRGIPELVERMAADGITLSTVGVGQGAADFLPELAEIGGGAYHFAADPGAIPSIFAEETTLATRAYIIEQQFFPSQASSSPILAGINAAPPLLGYIGTTAKAAAQVVLVNPDSLNPDLPDPILAVWQYGLGRTVAWTSDATGRWAQRWVGWEGFPRFWSQAVRYILSTQGESAASIRIEERDGTATITVDATTDAGVFLNGLEVRANVVGPDGQTQAVTLTQLAPGRYGSTFTPTTPGAYLIRVDGRDPTLPGSAAALGQTTGWVLSYSPEYQLALADDDPNVAPESIVFLQQLATLTGGENIAADGARAFDHDLRQPPEARTPVWPWSLALAAVLLPVDIAIRRLNVGRYEIRQWQARVRAATQRAGRPALPEQRVDQLASLRAAKDRANESLPRPAPPPIAGRPAPPPNSTGPAYGPPPRAGSPAKPAALTPDPTPRPKPAGSTSAELLARKRARERKGD